MLTLKKQTKETFYTVTGINSKPGEILFKEMNKKDKNKFLRVVTKFQFELNLTISEFPARLLFKHFKDAVKNRPYYSLQTNVLTKIWRRYLAERKKKNINFEESN